MQTMGLEAIYPKVNTSKPVTNHKIYPYLLRGLQIVRIHQVWATDITYVPMAEGYMYLIGSLIYTVGTYWLGQSRTQWMLSGAVGCCARHWKSIRPPRFSTARAAPTDQGSQFTWEEFTGVLLGYDIRISMDGKGRALDNIFVERLWRTVKYENIYLKAYADGWQLETGLASYFEFYNHRRFHQALNYQTPVEVLKGIKKSALNQVENKIN